MFMPLREGEGRRRLFFYFTENLNTRWLIYFSPGFRKGLGHSGWFGESGYF